MFTQMCHSKLIYLLACNMSLFSCYFKILASRTLRAQVFLYASCCVCDVLYCLGFLGLSSVEFCSVIVTSCSTMFGWMKSVILLAKVEGRSKGKPMARLSGNRRSRSPQKLDASLQVNSRPSPWSTCNLTLL